MTLLRWLRATLQPLRGRARRLRDRAMRAEHVVLARHGSELTSHAARLAALERAMMGRRPAQAASAHTPPPVPEAMMVGRGHARPAETSAARADANGRISVVMPVRDRATLVGAAIESVRAQSFQDWELLVVDDGSADGTAEVVEGYLHDSRIRLLRTPPRGLSSARNLGLAEARGGIVAYLDSDNEMLPGYLAGVADAFAADPALECTYAALVTDRPLGGGGCVLSVPFDRAALETDNSIDLNTVAHRTGVRAMREGFDETLTRLVDWDFVLRLTEDRPPLRLDFPAALYRTMGSDRVSEREGFGVNMVRVRRKLLRPVPRPLRVLYVAWHYPQQSETYIETEIRAVRRRGVEVAVWSAEDVAVPYAAGVTVHRGSLEAAIAAEQPDVVHIHWVSFAAGAMGMAAARGIPVTVRGHGFEVTAASVRTLLDQPGLARLYLFPHQAGVLGIDDPRVVALPSVFDTRAFAPSDRKDPRLVVRTATALPSKDLALFLELARRLPTHRFVLAACTAFQVEAYASELRAMAARMGSPATLRFDLGQEEVASLLAGAGLYLHTILPPDAPGGAPIGMPISIAEAMATGAVPLVRDLPPLTSYVGEAGLAYADIDAAEAAIRATMAWSDGQWRAARRRAADRAHVHHADDLVLDPLVRDWLDLAAPPP